ncbi:MAG: hypothetical protein HC932_00205, partial [Thermales bacterium]|nr:hypothetical protein [Thermales bacterium]
LRKINLTPEQTAKILSSGIEDLSKKFDKSVDFSSLEINNKDMSRLKAMLVRSFTYSESLATGANIVGDARSYTEMLRSMASLEAQMVIKKLQTLIGLRISLRILEKTAHFSMSKNFHKMP